MKIKIKVFGYLAEVLNNSNIVIENIADTKSLRDYISKEFSGAITIKYKIAVDREIVNENVTITSESEVALLPPFAGG